MKKFILFLIAAAYLPCGALSYAQVYGGQVYDAQPPMPDSVMPTNQLVFSWLGVAYSYEMRIARQMTLTATAMVLADNSYYEEYGERIFQIRPAVTVEPRYYYNLAHRAAQGRNTWYNSADYFSLLVGFTYLPLYIDPYYFTTSYISISPAWGIRRVWGHFLLDVNTGPVWHLNDFGTTFNWNLQIILGYIF